MAANEGESLRLISHTATDCPFLSKKPMTYGNAAVNQRLRVALSLGLPYIVVPRMLWWAC